MQIWCKKKTFLSFCVAYLKIVNFPYMVCFWEVNGAGVSCVWVSLTEQDHSSVCPMVYFVFSSEKSVTANPNNWNLCSPLLRPLISSLNLPRSKEFIVWWLIFLFITVVTRQTWLLNSGIASCVLTTLSKSLKLSFVWSIPICLGAILPGFTRQRFVRIATTA